MDCEMKQVIQDVTRSRSTNKKKKSVPPDFAQIVARITQQVCDENGGVKDLMDYPKKILRFVGVNGREFSIHDFLKRICNGMDQETIVLSVIYLDRLIKTHRDIKLTWDNVHRLLITALLVAEKFHQDIPLDNSGYAQLSGMTLREMNKLERDFCSMLQFQFYVNDVTFQKYMNQFYS